MKKASGFDAGETKRCRELAVEIIFKVDTRKAYADILLDQALRSCSLSLRDRGLLTELVYGTLRWRGRIDWHLSRYLRRPLPVTDAYLRNLLRLALYQLLFLDKVPDYAAVNEGVEQAKRYGGKKAAALINGVLRKILREKDRLLLPEAKTGLATHLAVLWSHPEWLVKRWLEYFGPTETEALLRANNQAAPLTLRANRLKDTRENLLKAFHENGLEAEATPWSPQGIRVKGSSGIERLPGFEQGLFQVQGEASQLIGYLLGPKSGERILDACAAPGGKTTHLAELMEDRGEIVATDISARGLEKLKQNVQRLGLRSIRSYRVDALGGLDGPLARPYDRVLVDAPCSALGTLRSHPEAKWHRSEADVKRLSGYQKRILERLSGYLKPGGTLIYATCTLTREENEGVVENFLDRHSDFALEDAAPHLPGEAGGLIKEKFFMALPHKHETEGFFAARMRKGGGKSG